MSSQGAVVARQLSSSSWICQRPLWHLILRTREPLRASVLRVVGNSSDTGFCEAPDSVALDQYRVQRFLWSLRLLKSNQ